MILRLNTINVDVIIQYTVNYLVLIYFKLNLQKSSKIQNILATILIRYLKSHDILFIFGGDPSLL